MTQLKSPARIPIAGPWITQKEIDYVTEAVTRAWYENAHEFQGRFESAFCRYTGRKYATTLPSCTSALHLTLLSLGIGPGDEVIVPDITWIASSAPISYVGAIPVFADIDPNSWCLCPQSLEANISARTKAVIVVDLYGNMPAMNAILSIARKHKIAVIEDAAEAHGSEYHGKKAGAFGRASVFSFHGSKTLTTGEGGMLLTDDKKIHARSLVLRDHGRVPGDTMFRNTEIAYKYKMSGLQAALGLAQLERIDELTERKREIFSWYQEKLKQVPGLTLNQESPGTKNSFWMITVIMDPAFKIKKESLIRKLAQQGIESRPFFYPLSSLKAYTYLPQAKIARKKNRNAYRISSCGINLPSGFNVTRENVEYVCAELKNILKRPL